MAMNAQLDIRPRTAGEILDDAWRFVRAEPLPLLFFSALFAVPAFAVVLLLLILPTPADELQQWRLPALAALLLPLTGLGSGASQEYLKQRAEGQRAPLGVCLRAALRRGLSHVTARALGLAGVTLGGLLLILPGAALGVANALAHPLIAAGKGSLSESHRFAGRQFAKFVALAAGRFFVWLFVAANLHALLHAFLWIAGDLAGLDTAFLEHVASLRNPVYLVSLVLFAWLLTAPFVEAVNFFLYLDCRVRWEGFDLADRIERQFPAPGKARAGAAAVLLAAWCFLSGNATAADQRLVAVQQARTALARITDEVKQADPYPGGAQWLPGLKRIVQSLDNEVGGPDNSFRWFVRAIDGFDARPQEAAVDVLTNLDSWLALLEESLTPESNDAAAGARSKSDVKSLLPDEAEGDGVGKPKKEKKEPEHDVQREEPQHEARGRGNAGFVGPNIGGLAQLGWIILAAIGGVVLALAAVLLWQHRGSWKRKAAPVQTGAVAATVEDLLGQAELSAPALLWQQADELARQGRFLDAVRSLYLAVLALLHRSNLIRYERTRTNGEYVRQLRGKGNPTLVDPFRRLTRVFELKWYGERGAAAADFDHCRGMAEEIKHQGLGVRD
jgi:hypothetical protein